MSNSEKHDGVTHMRCTSSVPLGLALLLVTAAAAEAQTLKIAYINSEQIVAVAPGASEAQAQFDQEVQNSQDEIAQLETELTNLQAQLEQQSLTLSPEAKANRQQQLQLRAQEYQARTNQLTELANVRRAELVQPILDGISAIIEELRVEGGYALILDAAAGSIISADPALDLTEEIIARLQTAAGVAPGGH